MDFLFQWGKGMFVENEGLYSFFTSTSGEKIMSELVIDDRFSFPDSLKDILVRIFSRKKRRLSPKKRLFVSGLRCQKKQWSVWKR